MFESTNESLSNIRGAGQDYRINGTVINRLVLNTEKNFKIQEILKSLSKQSVIYGISTALQPLGGFILLPLYSQYFEKSEYGTLSLILIISTIFGTIFHFGINSAFARSYFDYEEKSERIKVFNTALFILLIGVITQVILGISTSGFISIYILKNIEYKFILFVSIVTSSFVFLNTGLLNNLRVKELALRYSLISLFGFIINILVTLFLLRFYNKGIDSVIYAALIANILTTILLISVSVKEINLFNLHKSEIKILLKFGFPSILASLAIMIGEWGDRFLIDMFLTRDELGLYSMAFRVALIYNVLISMPFCLVWNPLMMKLRFHENIKEIFYEVTFSYVGISVVFIYSIFLFIEPILTHLGFGEKYYNCVNLIPILLVAFLLGSLQNIYSAGFFYERKPEMLFYIYLIIGVLNLVVSFFALNLFGLNGVLFSFACFSAIKSFSIYFFASRYFCFKIFSYEYFYLFIVAFFCMFIYKYFNLSTLPNYLVIFYYIFSFCIILYTIINKHILLLFTNSKNYYN